MSRIDLNINLSKINDLIVEINDIVPTDSYRLIQFRADLAGLLVVAMAATYETCVKEVLCQYAARHHSAFGDFASRNYNKINSKISIQDLYKYCETFDPCVHQKFKSNLQKKKNYFLNKTKRDISSSYTRILSWRHDFAHAGIRPSTVEEVTKTHQEAKRVLYIFSDAFSENN